MAHKKFKKELLNFINMMVGDPQGFPIFTKDFTADWKQRVHLAETAAEIYFFYSPTWMYCAMNSSMYAKSLLPKDEIDVVDDV